MKFSRCLGVRAAEVAAFSLLTIFWFAGCGGGSSADDVLEDLDSTSTDLVDVTDAGTDIAVPRDTTFADVDDDNPVTDIVSDSPDVSCGSCTGGKICVEGECQCPATQEDCGGTCTTLGTNEDCSECGDQCPTGGSCEAGTCRCPSGQVNCSGTCTTTGTDDDCSGCGDACVGVKSCQNKECVAEVDPDCVSKTLCVTDDDCESGSRCNQAMDLPACQKLYCGGYGTACSEDYFCLSKICWDDACMNDCNGLECGPDPVYGESCGICQEGATCRSNHCECEPRDHLECVAGNSTWIDSCGNVGEVKEGCSLACLNGACVDCEAVGKVNCSGTCTLLGTNTNCSGCGDVCPVGGSCEDGTCECPVGKADCLGTCKLLGTNTNCSGCGDVCPIGGLCNNGTCECPVGEADCFGTCKLLGTNTNCSGCGDVCTGGKECNDGNCECPVGEADCFGTCTLLGTNTNCSGCGDVCTGGKECNDGTCDCPVGEADCFGTCILIGTDEDCSGCGDECIDFAVCVNGTCGIPDCATCVTNADCGNGFSCQPIGANKHCLRNCTDDGDCSSGYSCITSLSGKSCIPVSYNCVACAYDVSCEEGMCCDFSTGTCKECQTECASCVYDSDCAAGLRCYETGGDAGAICVAECPTGFCTDSQNFGCANNGKGLNLCIPTNDICSGCVEPTSYLVEGNCVECRDDKDCGDLRICRLTDHVCEDAPLPCLDGLGSCKYYWSCYGDCPANDQACISECQAQLTAEGQEDLLVFNTCLYETCGGVPTADACIDENCTEAIIGCFWGCVYDTCDQMHGCFDGCPNDNPATTTNERSDCIQNCRYDSSEQAQMDQLALYDCAYEQCPICDTAETDAEWVQCNVCYNDAVMGACWEDYKKCTSSGTEYMTCTDFSICFNTCRYTAETQTQYDNCVNACQYGVDADALHDRLIAENCSVAACPICNTAETEEETDQCNECWIGTIYGDGTTVGACDAEWSRCTGTENQTCAEFYECSDACLDGVCLVECRGQTTLAALSDMIIANECSQTACPVCSIANPTTAQEEECNICWNASQTNVCHEEWLPCLN